MKANRKIYFNMAQICETILCLKFETLVAIDKSRFTELVPRVVLDPVSDQFHMIPI